MAAVFSKSTKQMLKNVIRHTNSHNKTVEEAEMWQQHERMKELGGLDPSNPSFGHDDRCMVRNDRDRRRNDYWNSRSEKRAYLSTSYRSRRAHMDEEEEKGRAGISTSTYWMRQLEKLESSDPNRWDHSGYKELYPQDFESDRSDSESCRQVFHRHREDRKSTTKKKKKKHHSQSKKQKQKEKRSTHRHRKQVRKRKPSPPSDDSESDSDSSSSDTSSSPHQKRQHVSRQQHREKTTSHRYSSSESSSNSYSYSDSRERSLDRKPKQRKRIHSSSVPKTHRYDKTRSSRNASSSSSGSSYTESDSDLRERSQSDRKPRKRTRYSSASVSSTDRSDSSSSPARKKAKTLTSKHKETSKSQKRSKHKSQKGRNGGLSRQAGRDEAENQLVVKMWKEANGYSGSSRNTDFDRRLQKEIASQYQGLKQEYAKKHDDRKTKINGRSSLKSKRRKRYSSSSSSSNSD